MPFFLAGVLALNTTSLGMVMTAFPATIIMVAPFSGTLSDRLGSRWLSSAGLCLCAVALVTLSGLGLGAQPLEVALTSRTGERILPTGCGVAIPASF